MSGKTLYKTSKEKEYIRDEVFLFFNSCNDILTLPNLYFNLENKFLKAGKNVDCVERDIDIYMKQLLIAPKAINLYNCDVKDLEISKYDGIFLDLCGCFSKSAEETLLKVSSGTKLAVTFMMARESRYIQRYINIACRELSYIQMFKKFGIEIEKFVKYSSTPQSPMCVFFGIKK